MWGGGVPIFLFFDSPPFSVKVWKEKPSLNFASCFKNWASWSEFDYHCVSKWYF